MWQMMKRILLILFTIHYSLFTLSAQDAPPVLESYVAEDMAQHINDRIDDVMSMTYSVSTAPKSQLDVIERSLQSMELKWNVWYADNQALLSQSDTLVEMVVDFGKLKAALADSVTHRRQVLEAKEKFQTAYVGITLQVETYASMYSKAQKLALVSQTAPKLEALKNREKLLMASLQNDYAAAKDAAAIDPSLKARMEALETVFVDIKAKSDAIQQLVYKPLIQRAKDYLISLAAASIVMMFVLYIGNLVKAARKARKAAEDVKKAMGQQDEFIPTI